MRSAYRFFPHLGHMPFVGLENGFVIIVEQHHFNGGGADIDSYTQQRAPNPREKRFLDINGRWFQPAFHFIIAFLSTKGKCLNVRLAREISSAFLLSRHRDVPCKSPCFRKKARAFVYRLTRSDGSITSTIGGRLCQASSGKSPFSTASRMTAIGMA